MFGSVLEHAVIAKNTRTDKKIFIFVPNLLLEVTYHLWWAYGVLLRVLRPKPYASQISKSRYVQSFDELVEQLILPNANSAGLAQVVLAP
jgi:hypothetical protein